MHIELPLKQFRAPLNEDTCTWSIPKVQVSGGGVNDHEYNKCAGRHRMCTHMVQTSILMGDSHFAHAHALPTGIQLMLDSSYLSCLPHAL